MAADADIFEAVFDDEFQMNFAGSAHFNALFDDIVFGAARGLVKFHHDASKSCGRCARCRVFGDTKIWGEHAGVKGAGALDGFAAIKIDFLMLRAEQFFHGLRINGGPANDIEIAYRNKDKRHPRFKTAGSMIFKSDFAGCQSQHKRQFVIGGRVIHLAGHFGDIKLGERLFVGAKADADPHGADIFFQNKR